MYSIYTVANTTPTSQKLLYSSLCTKRKGLVGSAVVALHAARERVGCSYVQISVQETGEVQQKEMQGYRKERGSGKNVTN